MRKQVLLTLSMVALTLTACTGKNTSAPAKVSTEITTEAVTEADTEKTAEETEKETEPETTAESGDKAEQMSENGTLSDNIYDFQISVGDRVYQFPAPYQQLIDTGWSFGGDETEKIPAQSQGLSEYFKEGKDSFTASFVNFGVNEAPVSECYVGTATFDSFGMKSDKQVMLAKGITLAKSTEQEVRDAYGEPTDVYEGKSSTQLTYKMDLDNYVRLSFDADKKYLTTINMRCFKEPENLDKGTVDESVPQIVTAYKAPEELGDDLQVYRVEFAGDKYQLPVPVSEFLKNGWTIIEDKTDMTVSGQGSGWVTMMKDNQTLRTLTLNYSPSATVIENSFVTSITAGKFNCNLPITIPKGITMGMSEADLLKALGDQYEKTEGSGSTEYVVEGVDSTLDGWRFVVREGKVDTIEAAYEPKMSQYYKDMGI